MNLRSRVEIRQNVEIILRCRNLMVSNSQRRVIPNVLSPRVLAVSVLLMSVSLAAEQHNDSERRINHVINDVPK